MSLLLKLSSDSKYIESFIRQKIHATILKVKQCDDNTRHDLNI